MTSELIHCWPKIMKKVVAIIVVTAIATFFTTRLIDGIGRYNRGNTVAAHARAILKKIDHYKQQNGEYPNQEWFASLGNERFTVEDRIWTYMTPPRQTDQGLLLIVTPIDYKPRYAYGFQGESVLLWDARSIQYSDNTKADD